MYENVSNELNFKEKVTSEDGTKTKPGLHDQELQVALQGEAFSFAVNPAKEKHFLGVFLGVLSALTVQHS